MTEFDFDLFVIGGGSGGVRAGRKVASDGYKVGLAEEYRMGGTCVIRGCVPKKLMVYASDFSNHFKDAVGYGWSDVSSRFDWQKFKTAKDAEIARLEAAYNRNYQSAGGVLFEERAVLKDAHHIELASGDVISADKILIATGGTPFIPLKEGGEHVITSNEIFDLKELPRRILIVGGGYIACEFAGIFNGLGSKVTQFYRGEQILRGFDREIRDFVAGEMQQKGIDIQLGADILKVEKTKTALNVTPTKGDAFEVDCVLYATGRVANTKNLGLEAAGVELDAQSVIKVDDFSQTNIPSIYAVGDVTNRAALTPVAIHEAMCFYETAFKNNPQKPDHALIPTAIFTQPEIGTIGISEEEASGEIDVFKTSFRPMNHILAGRSEKMMMKMIVDKTSQRILGLHIVGHGAGEMIQMAAVAIKMGATKSDFDRTMAVHPTASEELVTLY